VVDLGRQSEVNLANHDPAKMILQATEAIKLAKQLSLRNVQCLALTTLGKAQRAAQMDQLAMQTFSRASNQIESIRSQVAGAEGEQQLFFEDKVAPYQELVDLLVSRKTAAGDMEALRTWPAKSCRSAKT